MPPLAASVARDLRPQFVSANTRQVMNPRYTNLAPILNYWWADGAPYPMSAFAAGGMFLTYFEVMKGINPIVPLEKQLLNMIGNLV